jgi:hypothetical protein
MSRTRTLLLSCLGGLAVLLAGALKSQPPALAPSAPAVAVPDPEANRRLDQAIAAWHSDKLRWLRLALWQQGNLSTLTYQAEGVCVAGPDHRLRLDLQVHTASADSRFHVLSDGRTLWKIEQHGSAERTISRVDLKPVLAALHSAGTSAARRDDFYSHQWFAGPAPLLQSLRPGTTFTSCQTGRWHDRAILALTGVRPLPSGEKAWPDFLPRRCRLFLDAKTLWPHRLEWWGPVPAQRDDQLLLQLEFRDPVLGQAMPDKVFAFQPGKVKVKDLTGTWLDGVRNGFPQ